MKQLFSLLLLSAAVNLFSVTVVVSSSPDQTEKLALKELTEVLEKALQQKISVVSEKAKSKAIYLGNTSLAKKHRLTSDKMSGDEWCIQSVDGNLVINGGRNTGIIYAVLEFAEKELGVVYASEDCTFVPRKKRYSLPEKLVLRGRPAFAVRGIYSYFGKDNQARIRFMLRNRLNLFFDEKHPTLAGEWGIKPFYGSPRPCHNFYDYTRNIGKADEDILSLNSAGKRVRAVNASGPGQVCYSNPKTRRFFKEKLAQYIRSDRKKGVDYPAYVIDPNDNPARCLCKDCRQKEKKYGAFSGVMLEFINDIAAAFPDKEIISSAYMAASKAPRGIKPAANVTIRIAQLGQEWGNTENRDTMKSLLEPCNAASLEQIRKWSSIGRIAIWDYWILYAGKSNFPTLNTRAIWENSRLYRKYKVHSYFTECEEPHLTSFHALRLWLGAQCMKDPEFDFSAAVKRFMTAYYGPAAEEMFKFYEHLEKSFSSLKRSAGSLDAHGRDDLDKTFFLRADEILSRAEKRAANDKKYLARVKKERLSIDYARLARRRETGLVELQPVIRRFLENLEVMYTFPEISAGRIQKLKKQMKDFIEGLQVTAGLPDLLRDREIVADFTWPLLTRKARYVLLKDDPAAAGGKAVVFGPNRFHKKPLNFGVFDASKRRQLKNCRPAAVDKEGFHYYSTGHFLLKKSCFIWVHPSWNLQADLSRYYDTSGLNNDVEAFISIKTKPHFAVDRIIVVRKRKK